MVCVLYVDILTESNVMTTNDVLGCNQSLLVYRYIPTSILIQRSQICLRKTSCNYYHSRIDMADGGHALPSMGSNAKGAHSQKLRKREKCANYIIWLMACGLFGLQAFVLGWFYMYSNPDYHGAWWVFIVLEGLIFVHMLITPSLGVALMAGCSQWAMMSFVGSAKLGILYFLVQPQLDTTMFFGPHTLMMLVGVYPFLYALMMLRAQVSLFKSVFPAPTIEAVLFQNMMWHVLMDFIDIAQMFPYNSKDFQEKELSITNHHHQASVAAQFYCENEEMAISHTDAIACIY